MIVPAIWRSRRFLDLTDRGKVLQLYFLTSDHHEGAGCYHIPDAYVAADLGWSVDDYRSVRTELISAEAIVFDEATSEVFIERWMKHCPPANPKHAQKVQRLISEIDSDVIRERAEADFDDAMAQAERRRADREKSTSANRELTRTGYMSGRHRS